MQILIDCHIPLIKGLLDSVADVEYIEPASFTPMSVHQADALIIRTRTQCDAALLDGSAVKLIATATIGYDHIDTAYCTAHGIEWVNAPGCNAWSVANYIDAAIRFSLHDFKGKRIGVVGVGHVGSKVCKVAEAMGMKVMPCDPPRVAAADILNHDGSEIHFYDLNEIAAKADVITLHVPLDATTHHIINSEFLRSCKSDAIIINASRGAVLSTNAALNATQKFVIDCWEGEPDVNRQLLEKALLATPHIAGYSIDGKANGTVAVVNAVSNFFDLGVRVSVDLLGLPPKDYSKRYDIESESIALKSHPEKFEWFRNNYPIRRDLISNY